jgi:hypothetical protein
VRNPFRKKRPNVGLVISNPTGSTLWIAADGSYGTCPIVLIELDNMRNPAEFMKDEPNAEYFDETYLWETINDEPDSTLYNTVLDLLARWGDRYKVTVLTK